MNYTTSRRIQHAQLLIQTSRERLRETAAQMDHHEPNAAAQLRVTTALLTDALNALDDLSERALL